MQPVGFVYQYGDGLYVLVDDDTLYTVAELPDGEADMVSPLSLLGHALI